MALKFMVVGDSIPAQSEPNNFYTKLYTRLVNSGYPCLFVGQSNGVPPTFHEGHPGFKILQLDVEQYLTANACDIMLLHVGVNDINNDGISGQVAADRKDELYGRIAAKAPQVLVLDAQIMPVKTGGVWDAGSQQDIVDYKAALVVTAKNRAKSGMKVALVDCHSGYDKANWFTDDVHPDTNGAAFMMERFFQVIMRFLSPSAIGAPGWDIPNTYFPRTL